MGRAILGPAVRLDLNDATDAFRIPRASTDQERSEQRFSGRQGA